MPNVLLLGMGERPCGAGLLDASGVREPCRLVGERSCGSQTSSWVADQQLAWAWARSSWHVEVHSVGPICGLLGLLKETLELGPN